MGSNPSSDKKQNTAKPKTCRNCGELKPDKRCKNCCQVGDTLYKMDDLQGSRAPKRSVRFGFDPSDGNTEAITSEESEYADAFEHFKVLLDTGGKSVGKLFDFLFITPKLAKFNEVNLKFMKWVADQGHDPLEGRCDSKKCSPALLCQNEMCQAKKPARNQMGPKFHPGRRNCKHCWECGKTFYQTHPTRNTDVIGQARGPGRPHWKVKNLLKYACTVSLADKLSSDKENQQNVLEHLIKLSYEAVTNLHHLTSPVKKDELLAFLKKCNVDPFKFTDERPVEFSEETRRCACISYLCEKLSDKADKVANQDAMFKCTSIFDQHALGELYLKYQNCQGRRLEQAKLAERISKQCTSFVIKRNITRTKLVAEKFVDKRERDKFFELLYGYPQLGDDQILEEIFQMYDKSPVDAALEIRYLPTVGSRFVFNEEFTEAMDEKPRAQAKLLAGELGSSSDHDDTNFKLLFNYCSQTMKQRKKLEEIRETYDNSSFDAALEIRKLPFGSRFVFNDKFNEKLCPQAEFVAKEFGACNPLDHDSNFKILYDYWQRDANKKQKLDGIRKTYTASSHVDAALEIRNLPAVGSRFIFNEKFTDLLDEEARERATLLAEKFGKLDSGNQESNFEILYNHDKARQGCLRIAGGNSLHEISAWPKTYSGTTPEPTEAAAWAIHLAFGDDFVFNKSWNDDYIHVSSSEDDYRRRLPELSSVETAPPTAALPSKDGASLGLWALMLLTLAFLVYWFIVHRFIRPARKPLPRDSLRDLEEGTQDLHLRAD